ncbi:trypsin-4-like [Copidosoma floridanum]|uniref:trypsin-4-like n=1 Tax=Copidosoma floridanum TaxID=29053 RepID=UPI0006C94E64|nr:trypsin-4-like [Copidosoma floridanum]
MHTVPLASSVYVNITDFTYHASVRRSGRHACSGALVHQSWIITAASCVRNTSAANLTVLLGSPDLNGRTGRLFPIAEIVSHPGFDATHSTTNNVALLKTGEVAQGWDNVLPIFLPSSEDYHLKDGSLLVVSGWRRQASEHVGEEVGGRSFESRLSATVAPLVNQRVCVDSLPTGTVEPGKMLCAGYARPGPTEITCQGDLGAPLARDDVLLGILASTEGCDPAKGRPAVYARISAYLPWILDTIR